MSLDLRKYISCENVQFNRSALFSRKKKEIQINLKDSSLIIKKNGKLTQVHKDIIEAILIASQVKILTENGLDIAFNIKDVLKELGHKYKNNNQWFIEKLNELFNTSLQIKAVKENEKIVFNFHVIDKFGYLQKSQHTVNQNTGKGCIKETTLFGIRFSVEFYQLFINTMLVVLPVEKRRKLIQIKSQLIKSIIRYCISNKELNMYLRDLLYNIGEIDKDASKQVVKNKVHEIKKHKELLKEFGIELCKCRKDKRKYCIYYKSNNIFSGEPITFNRLKHTKTS